MTFAEHLSRFTPADWAAAVDTLAPEIHPIDLDATRVWLAFFPLQLHLALVEAPSEERASLERRLGLMGKWRLSDQIDSSHTFLYGHRYWPQVKRAIVAISGETAFPKGLPEIVERIADAASRTTFVDRDQLLGISVAGLMTFRQTEPAAFSNSPASVHLSQRVQRGRFARSCGAAGVSDRRVSLDFCAETGSVSG